MGPRRRRSAAAAGSSADSPRRGRTRSRSSAPRTRSWAAPLGLQLRRPGVGGLFEERWPGLPPQLPAEQERCVGTECHLHRCHGLGGVPHIGEPVGRHLEMELYGGAGGLRGDRRRGAGEPLDPFDVEGEILAPGRQHLFVEQGVTVDVGEIRGDHVMPGEGRENSDHHDPRVDLTRFAVGISEAGTEFLGELVENPSGQPVRSHVHFHVEHSEFGLEITARDTLQHLGIHHPGHPVGPREIQLDLQTHQILGPVEPILRQESPQHRQAHLQLSAVLLPIGQSGTTRFDLLTHRSVPPRSSGQPAAPGARVTIDNAHTE